MLPCAFRWNFRSLPSRRIFLMRLRDRTKLRLNILLCVVLISGIIGGLVSILAHSVTSINLWAGIFTGVGISLSIGGSEIFFLREWMKRKSFTTSILLSTAYFLLAIICIFLMWSAFFGENGFIGLNFGQLLEEQNMILFSLLVSLGFSLFFQINGVLPVHSSPTTSLEGVLIERVRDALFVRIPLRKIRSS